jgi:hypothetical protein
MIALAGNVSKDESGDENKSVIALDYSRAIVMVENEISFG